MKEYKTSETKLITLKTKQLRFNDVGFIRNDGDAVQAELFSAGQAVERFEINRLVCVSRGCMTKAAFNADYLHEAYPETLMQNVLLGRPIFGGLGRRESEGGLLQQIEGKDYDIIYRVKRGETYFKDRRNKILVKIRDLPEAAGRNEGAHE